MRNRRIEQQEPRVLVRPKLRLRYVLLTAMVGLLGLTAFPRAKAAWQLHDRATALANYGLCMAGPTGPSAVVGGAEAFAVLLRRRLITQQPHAQPFTECRPAYEQYTGPETGAALLGQAGEFIEYGSSARDSNASHSLMALIPDTSILDQLHERAWPFIRNGYTTLLRPSSHAPEAAHPIAFPVPVLGSGLPHWEGLYRTAWTHQERQYLAVGHGSSLALFQSSSGGQDWTPASLASEGVGEHAGRCAAGNTATSFLFEHRENKIVVVSLMGDEPVSRTSLALQATPRSSSCDATTAVFIAEPEAEAPPFAVLCQHSGRCGRLRLPADSTAHPFDVAQLSGVTVIASVDAGIVRARSSRDRGKTWTPAVVALDAVSSGIALSQARDVRLQVVGERLLLWLPQDDGQQDYPLVVSEDYGASFRGALPASSPPSDTPLARR